jgi:hypothetical protein
MVVRNLDNFYDNRMDPFSLLLKDNDQKQESLKTKENAVKLFSLIHFSTKIS